MSIQFEKEIELKDIDELAQGVLDILKNNKSESGATILLLQGDLGAGKTTFSQVLAKELGVKEVVVSPTFVILKNYTTHHPDFERLIHIDAYRLHNGGELMSLGWDEYVADPKNLMVVEWPSQVSDLWTGQEWQLDLSVIDTETRLITFKKGLA